MLLDEGMLVFDQLCVPTVSLSAAEPSANAASSNLCLCRPTLAAKGAARMGHPLGW